MNIIKELEMSIKKGDLYLFNSILEQKPSLEPDLMFPLVDMLLKNEQTDFIISLLENDICYLYNIHFKLCCYAIGKENNEILKLLSNSKYSEPIKIDKILDYIFELNDIHIFNNLINNYYYEIDFFEDEFDQIKKVLMSDNIDFIESLWNLKQFDIYKKKYFSFIAVNGKEHMLIEILSSYDIKELVQNVDIGIVFYLIFQYNNFVHLKILWEVEYLQNILKRDHLSFYNELKTFLTTQYSINNF